MKRFQVVVGLCLVAICAICAMASSAAQAAEVRSCAKPHKVRIEYEHHKYARIREGKYEDKNCTILALENTGRYPTYTGPEGEYELGSSGLRFRVLSANGKHGEHIHKPKLEMVERNWIVQCTGASGKGEWTGPKAGVETVVFRGCTLNVNHEKCTSAGKNEGEIATSPTDLSVLGFPEEVTQLYFGANNEETGSNSVGPLEGEVWVEASSFFAEYSCGSAMSFRTAGSVAGKVNTVLNESVHRLRWYDGPGEGLQNLTSEYSTDGGVTWAPVGGSTVASYEPVATRGGGLEVVEPG